MSVVGSIVHAAAVRRLARLRRAALDPAEAQARVLRRLMRSARKTAFGRDHLLGHVRHASEFAEAVPLRDYAGMEPWWRRARSGEPDVAWPGVIENFAVSSGTTAGEKYLPVSERTIRSARGGGFDNLVPFLAARPDRELLAGRLLFLGGATTLREEGPAFVGDMTGIMGRRIPMRFARRRLPSPDVAADGDWARKIDRTIEESLHADVRLLAGVPSWILLLLERVVERARVGRRARATIREVWPNLSVYLHGGMAFEPYRRRFRELVGDDVWCLEGYSASEGGMLAVQDRRDDPGLVPVADRGVFFEFVPSGEVGSKSPRRLALADVEPDVDYAVALTTDSGIYAYLVGDVVRFLSVRPHRLVFAGRLAHTMNAFGEHVSGGELDRAVVGASMAVGARVREFAVAARFPDATHPRGGHIHYVEFEGASGDAIALANEIDRRIAGGNEDYAAHRRGNFGIDAPEVRVVAVGAFYAWMLARGKFGGQHKVPRVLSTTLHADWLEFLDRTKPEGRGTLPPPVPAAIPS